MECMVFLILMLADFRCTQSKFTFQAKNHICFYWKTKVTTDSQSRNKCGWECRLSHNNLRGGHLMISTFYHVTAVFPSSFPCPHCNPSWPWMKVADCLWMLTSLSIPFRGIFVTHFASGLLYPTEIFHAQLFKMLHLRSTLKQTLAKICYICLEWSKAVSSLNQY